MVLSLGDGLGETEAEGDVPGLADCPHAVTRETMINAAARNARFMFRIEHIGG